MSQIIGSHVDARRIYLVCILLYISFRSNHDNVVQTSQLYLTTVPREKTFAAVLTGPRYGEKKLYV